jgi:hypothetical protein
MKMRLLMLGFVMATFVGIDALNAQVGSCGPDVICGFECNSLTGYCEYYAGVPMSTACTALPGGCISSRDSECCNGGGLF